MPGGVQAWCCLLGSASTARGSEKSLADTVLAKDTQKTPRALLPVTIQNVVRELTLMRLANNTVSMQTPGTERWTYKASEK